MIKTPSLEKDLQAEALECIYAGLSLLPRQRAGSARKGSCPVSLWLPICLPSGGTCPHVANWGDNPGEHPDSEQPQFTGRNGICVTVGQDKCWCSWKRPSETGGLGEREGLNTLPINFHCCFSLAITLNTVLPSYTCTFILFYFPYTSCGNKSS